MHSILSFSTRILRWMIVIVSVAVFSVCQDTAIPPAQASHLYKVQLSTGEILSDTFVGARLRGAVSIASKGAAGWSAVGAADSGPNALERMVYSQASNGALAVTYYGGSSGTDFLGFSALTSPGEEWTAAAVADLNGDGNPDVVFVNKVTGQVDVFFYGGLQGTALIDRQTISPLSAVGWNLVGAADLNGDGRIDLVLQNPSTRQVMVDYLGGPKGTTVVGTEELIGDFVGWTAAGMEDVNGDGHPDLILFSDTTGESMVSYRGGSLGVTPLGTQYLDRLGSRGWKIIVPAEKTQTLVGNTTGLASAPSAAAAPPNDNQAQAKSVPVLIFNGTGTSASDVTAVENVVSAAGLAYNTANSSQLDGMTQAQLAAYTLFIVPGGNSITIGKHLSSGATSNVRNAVAQNGLNYLGFCAGAFFGGFSAYYNGVDLTSGVWFDFYADYYKGINKEPVHISFPGQGALDIYWQDGPELSGWGKVVGKYPNGQPAISEDNWGSGFVILSGVHPEAPASWRYGMNFKTPLDVDLAYAGTLVKAALNRTMLPHY
ncbi:MAG TPA: FG-GAP-like repeat-containing protein [Terriglobales bacterium]|nr:FG-GAP-like repeat-containing protein [Terriglobales bacterium]